LHRKLFGICHAEYVVELDKDSAPTSPRVEPRRVVNPKKNLRRVVQNNDPLDIDDLDSILAEYSIGSGS
jgi:hypothetical protein